MSKHYLTPPDSGRSRRTRRLERNRRTRDVARTLFTAAGDVIPGSTTIQALATLNEASELLDEPGRAVGRFAGAVAGAATGTHIGETVGARIGEYAGSAFDDYMAPPSPVSTSTKTMPWNGLANRATMKKSYRKGGKLRGNMKDVYVPRKLRKQVREVIDDEKAHGAFYRRETYTIGFYTTGGVPGQSAAQDQRTTFDGRAGQALSLLMCQESNFSQQWWGAGGISGNTAGLILDNPIYNNRNWVYFTPKQILDAASMLFNNKPVNPDYNIEAGDIATQINAAGADIAAFKNQGLEIDIENAYVSYEIRNNGERPIAVDFYHCVQKEKFQESTPLTDFISAVEAGGWVDSSVNQATATNRIYVPPVVGASTLTAAAAKHYVLSSGLVEPNQLGGFNNLWRYTKVTVVMQPGEICVHKLQGPRNYQLNYKKLYTGPEDQSKKFFRDTTVCVMAKVRTDTMYGTNGVVPTPADLTINGRGVFTTNNKLDQMTQPVTIRATQVIKLKCPDVAGFAKNAAGTISQPLNMQVPRKVFMDLSDYRKGELTYTFSNEENPVAQRTDVQAGIYG